MSQSKPDHLTGLPVFERRTLAGIQDPLPADSAFIAIDLRDFASVNYTHGFVVGDAVLVETARRLRAIASPWPVFRFSGNQFLIVARPSAEAELGAQVAALRQSVEQPHPVADPPVVVGTFAAAAVSGPGATSARSLYVALDQALGAVKQNRWSELLVAPPGTDQATWFGRPTAR